MKSFLQFLKRASKYFRATKRVWRKPPQADLLIIDRGTASPLDEMFAHHKPHIMDIRGESVNMWALLRAVPKIHFGAVAYLEAYIDFVKPKLILSRTDNNHTLWQLKRRKNVNYQVALVQNGWRFEFADSVPNASILKKYQVDGFLTFGDATIRILRSRLEGEFIGAGSIKANIFQKIKKYKNDAPVVFVSTFRASKHKNYLQGTVFFEYLENICEKYKKKVLIVGCERSDSASQTEKHFYSGLFSSNNWDMVSRVSETSSYEFIRSASCVIVESSSLGYESLAMGLRTGFIAYRPQHKHDRRFGKPLEFGEKGPFWTNDPSEEEIGRILDYLLTVSDEQWERDSGWIRDQLMVHDYGNTKIRAYVESVLADSLESS